MLSNSDGLSAADRTRIEGAQCAAISSRPTTRFAVMVAPGEQLVIALDYDSTLFRRTHDRADDRAPRVLLDGNRPPDPNRTLVDLPLLDRPRAGRRCWKAWNDTPTTFRR